MNGIWIFSIKIPDPSQKMMAYKPSTDKKEQDDGIAE